MVSPCAVFLVACLPLVAECLRALDLPAMSEHPTEAPPTADEVKSLLEEAAKNETKRQKGIKKEAPIEFKDTDMVVQYNQEQVEERTHANFFWERACTAPSPTGLCTFTKSDGSNPPHIHVRLKDKVDGTVGTFRMAASVEVLGFTTEFAVSCKACGSSCVISLPLAGSAVMEAPACPLPTEFNVTMPDMDWGRIPTFVRGYGLISISLSRDEGGKEQVFYFTLDTWV